MCSYIKISNQIEELKREIWSITSIDGDKDMYILIFIYKFKAYINKAFLPGCWVFVLAKPSSSVWFQNRKPSSGNGDTGSVNSSKDFESLNRISKEELVSL